jgi:hypothetical protein
MQERTAHHARHWPLIAVLVALSAPLVVMYVYQIVDTVTTTPPGLDHPRRRHAAALAVPDRAAFRRRPDDLEPCGQHADLRDLHGAHGDLRSR